MNDELWAATEGHYRTHWWRPPGAVPLVTRASLLAAAIAAERARLNAPFWHVSTRKIGGLRFVKLGRFCISICITKTYRPL